MYVHPTLKWVVALVATITVCDAHFTLFQPPPSLYLGLYSDSRSPGGALTEFKRDNHQEGCYTYTRGNSSTEHCRFYGDCCVDPMRVRERLEPGTFSCLKNPAPSGESVYIVDKCPKLTEGEILSRRCSEPVKSKENPADLRSWPVTASRTGITYKNIYCAVCHGVLDVHNTGFPAGIGLEYDHGDLIDFWWMAIKCDNETIAEFAENYQNFTFSDIKTRCWHEFAAPTQPHRCLDAVRSCPHGYNDTEIKSLCELAPVDYRYNDGQLYRNRFCQLCHGLNSPTLPTSHIIFPQVLQNGIIAPYVGNPFQSKFIELKPRYQTTVKSGLSVTDYTIDPAITTSTSIRLGLTNNITESYTYITTANPPPTDLRWDLGSILCDSPYVGICDKFIARPEEGCSGPGCGLNSWQDVDRKCYHHSDFRYDVSTRQQADYVWPASMYGKYYSSCNSNAATGYVINCRCDSRCHYFGECCFDAPEPLDFTKPADLLKYVCVLPGSEIQGTQGYALIATCPTGSDPRQQRLCEQGVYGEWNPLGWPVYNNSTKLDYLNMYCALCNGVATEEIKFWNAVTDCGWERKVFEKEEEFRFVMTTVWTNCTFRNYVPKDKSHAYPCFITGIVSECPDYFSGWKISKDCAQGPVSWVNYKGAEYRNSYCAICNLGDQIIDASFIHHDDDWYSQIYLKITAPTAVNLGAVTLDMTNNECCWDGDCQKNSRLASAMSQWGSVAGRDSNHCLKLPFDSTCSSDFDLSDIGQTVTEFDYLCSATWFPSETSTPPWISGPKKLLPVITTKAPSFARLLLTNVGELPLTQSFFADTNWSSTNNNLRLCSNGSFVDISSGRQFLKLRVSPSLIQVNKEIVVIPAPRIQLKDYDYVLLSLSLLCILVYSVYMVITGRKTMKTPELMMLSLLISLFGALITFSIANLPSGIGCRVLAAMQQFLFLSSLFWSSAIGINITHSIFTIRSVSTTRKKYFFYCIYSLGVPLLLVLITYGISVAHQDNPDFKVYRETFCFLQQSEVIYGLFLVPIYLLVGSNLILCILCMVKVQRSMSIASNDKDRWKKNVITCIKLSVTFGISWVLLFIFTASPNTKELEILMQVSIEIQGILVVFVNVLSWGCLTKVQSLFKSEPSTTQPLSSSNDSTKPTELTPLPVIR